MTLWQSGGLVFGYLVYAIAWFAGGRAERFGVGVFLLSNLLASRADAWEVSGYYPGFMVLDALGFLIFGWLCLRSNRWWPMGCAAALGLIVLSDAIRLIEPGYSHYAMASAKIGLFYVSDLTLLLGVWERWLAGEPAAGPAAWADAARITRTRRPRARFGG
ncbi:hypothetical protein [Brevundimonas sp.]|uniref:hypothetical protein n=1 Tax=Brevundimonas sp. TaxID=1871086 RepID=UPI002EDB1E80